MTPTASLLWAIVVLTAGWFALIAIIERIVL